MLQTRAIPTIRFRHPATTTAGLQVPPAPPSSEVDERIAVYQDEYEQASQELNAAKAVSNFTRAAEFMAKIEEIERAIAELQQQERLTVYVDPFPVLASAVVIEKEPLQWLG